MLGHHRSMFQLSEESERQLQQAIRESRALAEGAGAEGGGMSESSGLLRRSLTEIEEEELQRTIRLSLEMAAQEAVNRAKVSPNPSVELVRTDPVRVAVPTLPATATALVESETVPVVDQSNPEQNRVERVNKEFPPLVRQVKPVVSEVVPQPVVQAMNRAPNT
jgi:hypothetical protein